MKSNKLPFAKGLQPILFCFGMFILAMCFSVVICCSTFYAFHSMKFNGEMAKSSQTPDNGSMKNIYAAVK